MKDTLCISLFYLDAYFFQIEFNADEPCGINYSKSLTAKRACQKLLDNIFLEDCRKAVNLKFYYNACLYDYCNLEILRKDGTDPFAKNTHVIRAECTVSRSYANHCAMKGVKVSNWEDFMHCPIRETQDAVLSISCPQNETDL